MNGLFAKRLLKATALAAGLAWLHLAVPTGVHAAAVDKEKSESYLREAHEFLKKGDGNAAIIQLKNALQTDPGNVSARKLLGEIYLRTGNGPSAEKELNAAMRRGSTGLDVKILLARAMLLQGKNQEALDLLSGELEHLLIFSNR